MKSWLHSFWALPLGCLAAAGAELWSVPLQDAVKIQDFQLPKVRDEKRIDLPSLPQKEGLIPVFKAMIYADAPHARGCNYCAEIVFNERPLGRYVGEKERLLGRAAAFHLATHPGRDFPVFSGSRLMTAFGPNEKSANKVSVEGDSAEFILRLDDVVRGVDGNTLLIRNIRSAGAISVRCAEVGYLPRKYVQTVASAIPVRGKIKAEYRNGDLTLKQGTRGGFVLETPRAGTIFVETAVGIRSGIPPVLVAEDGVSACRIVPGANGIRLEAMMTKELHLVRELSLADGLLMVRDKWTNVGDKTMGVPFRYRFFRPDDRTKFYLGGNADADTLNSEAQNPTLFLESAELQHCGWGVAAESDWLRLLLAMRKSGGVGEIYTDQLALDAGKSVELNFSITPEVSGEGYWGFLNALRNRWKIGTVGMAAPLFWDSRPDAAPGKDIAEKIRNGYAHLGKAYVVIPPWLDCDDIRLVTFGGRYPKLAADAPRAPGRTPDLDAARFLKFDHRENQYRYWQEMVQAFAATAPQCGVMAMLHPSMVGVYKPLAGSWPIAGCEILNADGKPFESMTYSRGWFGKWYDRDWGVYYYLAVPGNAFFKERLASVERMTAECGLAGVYCDEFSWSFAQRGYSRYDYRNSDGYSADLDEKGGFLRRKSDNAFRSIPFQESVVGIVHKHGKFFCANTAAATFNGMIMPIMRFVEGGNGASAMAQAHLNHVPLVLGNYGERKTLAGIMAAVREALHMGAIYSPYGNVNLLLQGSDNFVSKLYPLTVTKIYADTVIGKERFITAKSGSWNWPEAKGKAVTVYVFAETGEKQSVRGLQQAAEKFAVEVPANGLVIAEIKS